LTSYCNSQTLPATRGPNFRLPANVVAALDRVRDVEQRGQEDSTKSFGCQEWRAASSPDNNGRQTLPPPPPPPIEKEADYYQSLNLSNRRPTVDELMVEVDYMFMNYYDIAGIVIAGEGEPTLALDKLLDLLSRLRRRQIGDNNDILPIRINTNGIIRSISDADRLLRHAVDLQVDLTVALMSHDAVSYQTIMDVDAHDIVVDFCRRAVQQLGATVELTAVDRPDGLVDRAATERLARDILGVQNDDSPTSLVRWRPYFP
jgi:pyruvate-formate lyase-activating enzyme